MEEVIANIQLEIVAPPQRKQHVSVLPTRDGKMASLNMNFIHSFNQYLTNIYLAPTALGVEQYTVNQTKNSMFSTRLSLLVRSDRQETKDIKDMNMC